MTAWAPAGVGWAPWRGLDLVCAFTLWPRLKGSCYPGKALFTAMTEEQEASLTVWVCMTSVHNPLTTASHSWAQSQRTGKCVLSAEMEGVNSLEQSAISVQLVSHVTFCNPMDCSTPGLPVYHQLPEFTQNCVHLVSDAIQPSHLLLSHSPLAFSLSQHQGLFQWVSSSHQVTKIWELQLQHQSFQWTPRTDFL